MAHLRALRGLGNTYPTPIVDRLLTSYTALYERGRIELDSKAHALQEVDIEIPYRKGFANGQWVEVLDSTTGQTWQGKVIGIEFGDAQILKLRLVRATVK